jgi:hypothetical protein
VTKDRFSEADNSLGVSSRMGESSDIGSKEGNRRFGIGKGCDISLSDSLGSDSFSGVVVKSIDDLSGGVSLEGIVGDELFNEVGYVDQLVSPCSGVTLVKVSVVKCCVRLKSVSSWDWVFVTQMLRLIITSQQCQRVVIEKQIIRKLNKAMVDKISF